LQQKKNTKDVPGRIIGVTKDIEWADAALRMALQDRENSTLNGKTNHNPTFVQAQYYCRNGRNVTSCITDSKGLKILQVKVNSPLLNIGRKS